jgi:two-component system, cell cycle response regulator
MSSLLSSQGYRVKTAGDGFLALDMLEAGGIDLVLLDLMMSRMDGVEVCTHIRKGAQHMTLPVVFTTSLHDRASRIRAKEAGADDFLVKPIDGLELLVRVERLLRVRAQIDLVYAERDRLAKELAGLRSPLPPRASTTRAASVAFGASPAAHGASVLPGNPSDSVAAPPTSAPTLEELAREHRRFIADALRSCEFAQNDEARAHLQEMLRSAEELERRVTATTTAFPLSQTRSTL